ncbi:uncharacterized protein BT62DRAFT_1052934 [Guyanagaster necrorhizus]|uniref:GmrSD restriction endonucleases N-terminal domain-containing protein n=1 Tax=Guyanagaster necrorhizus TaxID=856835 RepID=A0A9P7VX29_9AGAR|nr:uncharacterized protein BT62DRAFT_1052934 [Guyanagaster necrorhizus MCA 3950]KAG7449116.1 hypothetical protein BT62DRAFT_1052934 [Guyanagaster necrorhizus MCA 3950]
MPPKDEDQDEYVDEGDQVYDDEDEDDDPDSFKIVEPHPEPTTELFTTKQLHDYIHEGIVDLNPTWQRDVVWSEAKQSLLIDSIFRNFYIPPVVFAVTLDDDGEEVRVCVDGKQRLTSIQKFIDGQVRKDQRSRKNWWYTTSQSTKSTRAELPQGYKDLFAKKVMPCVLYTALTESAVRDIFQRVQLGVALTPAERLQAISTPYSEWVGDLVQKFLRVDGGISDFIIWDTKRSRDFSNLAYAMFCCDVIQTRPMLAAQKLESWLNRQDPPREQLKNEMQTLLKNICQIVSDKKYNSAFSKMSERVAPVEFVFMCVLVYVMASDPLEKKAKAIYNLRYAVRSSFDDIRMRNDTCAYLWDAVYALKDNPFVAPQPYAGSPSKKSRKRKSEAVGVDDDDFRPDGYGVRNLPKAIKTRSKH